MPPIGDRVEAFASRIAPGPARFRGEGFGSGLVVGASLGLVYAPCAGPILAGVITVSAAQDFTAGRLAVALSYAIGSALVLYALLLGGRRLADRLAPIRGQVQVAMGAVMICVAVLMAADARHPLPDRDRRRPPLRSSSTRPATWRRARRSPAT